MTEDEKTPECQHGMCHLCSGPGPVRRPGAPAWEAPLLTIRCGCACHGGSPRGERVPRARRAGGIR